MASIRLKMYRRDVRKDGTCGIYLQVIINCRKLELGLDLQWPPEKFDESKGCKPRHKDDELVDAYNLIIRKSVSKANEILIDYRLRDLPLDIDIFRKEYLSDLNKNNFVEYFRQKSQERWNKGLISDNTYKQEKTTLKKLQAFQDPIPFNSFHIYWGQEWDLHLRKSYGNEQNTLWSEKKRVKTYLTLAEADGIAFIDPYKKFKVKQVKSRYKALSVTEVKKLLDYYRSKKITASEKVILRRFLFSCCTGLRIGDLRSLTVENFNFKNGTMTIKPSKTAKYGTKIEEAPLNQLALILLEEEKKESMDGRLFYRYAEQYSNRTLKQIAKNIDGFDHELNHHIGRSTFASLYDQAGGNHRSLMELLGLTKFETLMKYVHTNKEVIREGIDLLNVKVKEIQKIKIRKPKNGVH
jgi:integrase